MREQVCRLTLPSPNPKIEPACNALEVPVIGWMDIPALLGDRAENASSLSRCPMTTFVLTGTEFIRK